MRLPVRLPPVDLDPLPQVADDLLERADLSAMRQRIAVLVQSPDPRCGTQGIFDQGLHQPRPRPERAACSEPLTQGSCFV